MSKVQSFDWRAELVSVTDGDTVRIFRERVVEIDDELEAVIRTNRQRRPRGIPIRLIILDTPEKGTQEWYDARADLAGWLVRYEHLLRVETYESAGWDRILGDIYVAGDRGNTATQHMLQCGWSPYIKARQRSDGTVDPG